MTMKRWQDWANLLLGLWLFASPWILGFAADLTPAWNAYVLGVAIVVFAAIAVYMPKAWEEAVNIILGIWMIVSPWVLGFSTHMVATRNAVIVGILVTAFAIWAMVLDTDFQKWRHGGHRPA
jgi:hypothetical protein